MEFTAIQCMTLLLNRIAQEYHPQSGKYHLQALDFIAGNDEASSGNYCAGAGPKCF